MSTTRTDKAECFVHYWQLLAPPSAPAPDRELRFAPPRRWRFDLAWPEQQIAVEVDGGQWVIAAAGGRHNRDSDREKLNAAAELGWRVLRFSTQMLERDPQACVDTVLRALHGQNDRKE